MVHEDHAKNNFVTEWGAFASNIMTFRLKNVIATFQLMVWEFFCECLRSFRWVFLEGFSVWLHSATLGAFAAMPIEMPRVST